MGGKYFVDCKFVNNAAINSYTNNPTMMDLAKLIVKLPLAKIYPAF
jgi:hypothetical protein